MSRKTILLIPVIAILASCHKDSTPSPAPNPAPTAAIDNYHLHKGSWWVYEVYDVDTLNNYTLRSRLDSNYISADTVIHSKTYHVMAGTYFNISGLLPACYADSSGWLIDATGMRYCNFNNITVVESPYSPLPSLTTSVSMLTGSQSIIVPAGSFNCVDAQTTELNPLSANSWQHVRHFDRNYCQGTGLIKETNFWAAQPSHWERRLVRYHLN
jgi:hypothetical protein